MSALPPKADIAERDWDVCYSPKSGITERQLDVRFVPETKNAATRYGTAVFRYHASKNS